MAKYPALQLTRKGRDVISKASAQNKGIVFTKVEAGDGDLGSKNIEDLTSLVARKMSLRVTDGQDQRNGQYTVIATLSNHDLDCGFWAREIGLYAKVEGESTEYLYAYTNGSNYVDYIPDKTNPIDSQIFSVTCIVGSTTNLSVLVRDETFITKGELTLHNNDVNAHPYIRNKITSDISDHNTSDTAHANLITRMKADTQRALQSLNNYVPLAGGTITGNLKVNGATTSTTDKSTNVVTTQLLHKVVDEELGKISTIEIKEYT